MATLQPYRAPFSFRAAATRRHETRKSIGGNPLPAILIVRRLLGTLSRKSQLASEKRLMCLENKRSDGTPPQGRSIQLLDFTRVTTLSYQHDLRHSAARHR